MKRNRTAYKNYARLANLHVSEVWYLKDRDGDIAKNRGIHGESNVWSTAQREENDLRT